MVYPTPVNQLAEPVTGYSKTGHTSFSRKLVFGWLVGMLLLSPIRIFTFPFNLEMVDYWIVATLPVIWLFFILRRQTRISMPYTVVLLLILLGSFVSSFIAPNALRSLVVILKEVYLYVWFVTLATLFYRMEPDDLRRILIIWACMVVGHGLLIIAQFLSPSVWQFTAGIVGKPAGFAHYRPSGLFMSEEAGDANKAALFQLLGFAPLLMAKLPRRKTIALAIPLAFSIMCTGSMGTSLAFTTGLITVVIALAVMGGHGAMLVKYFMQMMIVIVFVGAGIGIFFSLNENYQTRIESILVGRSERSADGRFDLWGRGADMFLERNTLFWGVGPGNFRDVDGMDKQLHNDLLAFTVERGLLTALFLVLFAGLTIVRSLAILKIYARFPDRVGAEVVVFLGLFAGVIVLSLTHQIFHTRELWSVMALHEAMLMRLTTELSKNDRPATQLS